MHTYDILRVKSPGTDFNMQERKQEESTLLFSLATQTCSLLAFSHMFVKDGLFSVMFKNLSSESFWNVILSQMVCVCLCIHLKPSANNISLCAVVLYLLSTQTDLTCGLKWIFCVFFVKMPICLCDLLCVCFVFCSHWILSLLAYCWSRYPLMMSWQFTQHLFWHKRHKMTYVCFSFLPAIHSYD